MSLEQGRIETKKRNEFFKMTDTKAFYILIFPFIAMVLLIRVVPFIWGIDLSFTNFSGFNLETVAYVGFDNYLGFFRDDTLLNVAIPSTLFIASFAMPIGLLVGLGLALLLNQKIKGDGFFRTVYYIPSIIPGVVTVLLWRILLNQHGGLVNVIIRLFQPSEFPVLVSMLPEFFGQLSEAYYPAFIDMANFFYYVGDQSAVYVGSIIEHFSYGSASYIPADQITNYFRNYMYPTPINWFNLENIRYSLFFILVWVGGAGVLTYLAALKNVPNELYESAAIDGARSWSRFYKITLPMLTPVIFFNLINGFIGAFQIFAQPIMLAGFGGAGALTGRPPNPIYTYVVHIFQEIFVARRFGYGLALVWILFFASIIVTRIIFWSSKYWVFYEADAKASKKKKKRKNAGKGAVLDGR